MTRLLYRAGGYLFENACFAFASVPNSSWKLIRELTELASGSILDVGCADGDMARITRMSSNRFSVGVDLYRPYLLRAKKGQIYSELLECDVRKLPFRSKSFETVLCLEVIEHLDSKEEGFSLIKSLEDLGTKRVVLSTPTGLSWQEGYGGNTHQEHHVGWLPQELQPLGYRPITLGLKESVLTQRIKSMMMRIGDWVAPVQGQEDLSAVMTMKIIDLILRTPYYILGKFVSLEASGHFLCVKDLS